MNIRKCLRVCIMVPYWMHCYWDVEWDAKLAKDFRRAKLWPLMALWNIASRPFVRPIFSGYNFICSTILDIHCTSPFYCFIIVMAKVCCRSLKHWSVATDLCIDTLSWGGPHGGVGEQELFLKHYAWLSRVGLVWNCYIQVSTCILCTCCVEQAVKMINDKQINNLCRIWRMIFWYNDHQYFFQSICHFVAQWNLVTKSFCHAYACT